MKKGIVRSQSTYFQLWSVILVGVAVCLIGGGQEINNGEAELSFYRIVAMLIENLVLTD